VSCCGHRPAGSFLFSCDGLVGATVTARKGTRQCRLNTSDARRCTGDQITMGAALAFGVSVEMEPAVLAPV
jgi:hypothetical protein